jgi:hypothetical protein
MRNFLKYTIIICSCLLIGKAYGQGNFTMYSMTKMAQAHYENPAYFANGKVYFGLVLGHNSFGVSNSGFRLNKVITQRKYDDSLELNQQALLKSLWKRNYLGTDIRNEIFGLGINIKKNYFSLSITNRITSNFIYPKDLFVLALEGNGKSLLGKRTNLDGLGFNLDGYVEYALGYNREINEKLRVGGRLKFLSGYANFTTKQSKLGLTTDSENFTLTTDGRFKFASSGFSSLFDSTSTEKFNFKTPYNFKNFGLAIDLGATYNITDKIEVSASLLDLGFIRWKNQTASYETNNLDFRFEGVDVKAFLNDSSDYLNKLKDTLLSKINNDITYGAYSSMLSARFYIGGKYKVNDWFTAGVTSYNQIVGKRLRTSLILSGTIQLKNWLGFTLNYSTYARSAGNLGFGLSLRGGPIQFYVMTDNLLSLNYWSTKNVHASFGLNLLIGKLDKNKATKSSFDEGTKKRMKEPRQKKEKVKIS